MAFWSDPTLDPKRTFKFRVTFDYLNNGATGTESTFLAQSADRPTYTISDAGKVEYLDKTFYFPGKITWTEVKIKFVDAIGLNTTNVSKKSYDYLATSGWVMPPNAGPQIGAAQMRTLSKNRSVLATRNIKVDVLDSDGNPVDQWVIKNAFIKTAIMPQLSYASEEVLTVEYTFRYDWAEYTTAQFI